MFHSGDSCLVYEKNSRWCDNAPSYAVNGGEEISAKEACCVCGGGLRLLVCTTCDRSLPPGAHWTGVDEYSAVYNTSKWIVHPNCSWDCQVRFAIL